MSVFLNDLYHSDITSEIADNELALDYFFFLGGGGGVNLYFDRDRWRADRKGGREREWHAAKVEPVAAAEIR